MFIGSENRNDSLFFRMLEIVILESSRSEWFSIYFQPNMFIPLREFFCLFICFVLLNSSKVRIKRGGEEKTEQEGKLCLGAATCIYFILLTLSLCPLPHSY